MTIEFLSGTSASSQGSYNKYHKYNNKIDTSSISKTKEIKVIFVITLSAHEFTSCKKSRTFFRCSSSKLNQPSGSDEKTLIQSEKRNLKPILDNFIVINNYDFYNCYYHHHLIITNDRG